MQGKLKLLKNLGYSFIKWVDEYDNEVTRDYQILNNCSLKAVFEVEDSKKIGFDKTAGVTFYVGGEKKENPTPIYPQKGTKWNDLKQSNQIPDVKCDDKYVGLGWYAVYEDGKYEYINEDEGLYEVKEDFTAKYVAYNIETGLVPISLKIDPEVEASTLYFGKTRTFKEFRDYYSIPETPTKGGYTFDAWYVKINPTSAEEKLTDGWQFPDQDETIEIYAKFNPIVHTITIKQPQHGTVDKETINVNNGTTLKEAVKDVKLTPESVEYEFDRWVDTSGNVVKDYYPITSDITIEPIFGSRKIYINEVADTSREYFESMSREEATDLEYTSTNAYLPSSSYWNKSLNNSNLVWETKDKSNDFKFQYETFKISVPVKPGTVTTKIKANITWHISSNGHFFGSFGNTSIQLFNLEDASSHPWIFTNFNKMKTKTPDKTCFYYVNSEFDKRSWSSWEEDRNYETTMVFTDTNNTESTKYFDHYIGVSFLIDSTKNADVSFKLSVNFERVEQE